MTEQLPNEQKRQPARRAYARVRMAEIVEPHIIKSRRGQECYEFPDHHRQIRRGKPLSSLAKLSSPVNSAGPPRHLSPSRLS